jgi:hypothetical protein
MLSDHCLNTVVITNRNILNMLLKIKLSYVNQSNQNIHTRNRIVLTETFLLDWIQWKSACWLTLLRKAIATCFLPIAFCRLPVANCQLPIHYIYELRNEFILLFYVFFLLWTPQGVQLVFLRFFLIIMNSVRSSSCFSTFLSSYYYYELREEFILLFYVFFFLLLLLWTPQGVHLVILRFFFLLFLFFFFFFFFFFFIRFETSSRQNG